MHRSGFRWLFGLLLVLSLLGGAYAASGFMMAASFSVAHPAALPHWRRVSLLYGAWMIISLAAALVSALWLWRTRPRSETRPEPHAPSDRSGGFHQR